jgi:hypothetical protein
MCRASAHIVAGPAPGRGTVGLVRHALRPALATAWSRRDSRRSHRRPTGRSKRNRWGRRRAWGRSRSRCSSPSLLRASWRTSTASSNAARVAEPVGALNATTRCESDHRICLHKKKAPSASRSSAQTGVPGCAITTNTGLAASPATRAPGQAAQIVSQHTMPPTAACVRRDNDLSWGARGSGMVRVSQSAETRLQGHRASQRSSRRLPGVGGDPSQPARACGPRPAASSRSPSARV